MSHPITDRDAFAAMAELAVLPYFPTEAVPRAAIANLILRMCSTAEEAHWLVNRVCDLWSKWEGPRELRAVLCSRFKPKDGISASSTVFPEGIVPPENRLPEFKLLPLPDGRMITADEQLDSEIFDGLRDKFKLPPGTPAKTPEEIQFEHTLEEAITGPQDREEVEPVLRRPRESAIIKLADDKPMPPASSPGQITPEDIERAVAENRSRREQE